MPAFVQREGAARRRTREGFHWTRCKLVSCSVPLLLPPPLEPGATNTQIGLISAHIRELHVNPPPLLPNSKEKHWRHNVGDIR